MRGPNNAERPPLSLKRKFKCVVGSILFKVFGPIRNRDGYDSFQSLKTAKKLVGKDVLMIHGEFDRTVPLWHCKVSSLPQSLYDKVIYTGD